MRKERKGLRCGKKALIVVAGRPGHMEEEYIISGFCRTFNQAQTVTCEIITEGDKKKILEVDCAYERCIHKPSCQVAAEIRQLLGS